jgi:hypothetical protein
MTETGPADRAADLVTAGINLLGDTATGEIVDALRHAGVRSVVLKGRSFRSWLYDSEAQRVSKDIDLIVRGADMPILDEVMSTLDYRYLGADTLGRGRPYCHVWQGAQNGLFVEVHRTLAGVGAPSDEAWTVLSEETEQMLVGGVPVEVLAAPARALHVALHAAQHGQRYEKTLTDLRLALEKLPYAIWEQAATLAARLEATPAFVAGLALLPEGEAIVGHLALSRKRPVDVALRAATAPPLAEGLEWLAALPGLRAKAAFVARHVVPPVEYMRVWSPLARRRRAGLVVAYAWRPLWLMRHAGPALLAWRRARKEAAT